MDSSRPPADGKPSGILKRGMTPTHELMAEWILQNPGGTLTQMSGHFGYSISWLSQVINTDMFKAYLKKRVGDIQAVVTQDVPTKMSVLANLACDRMIEVLEKTADGELIKDSFDKVMHRYGYAPNAKNAPAQNPGGVNIHNQQNVYFLSQDQLQKVRGRLIDSHGQPSLPSPSPAKEDDRSPAPTDAEKV